MRLINTHKGVKHKMDIKNKGLFVFLILLLFTPVLFSLEIGDEAPGFALPGIDKHFVYSRNYYGKSWVLLDFYATDCVACNEKLPYIEELAIEYADKEFNQFLIVTDSSGLQTVKSFFEERPTPLKILIDRYKVMAKKYGVEKIPHIILIDPEGKIVYKLEGESKEMINDIKKHLPPLSKE